MILALLSALFALAALALGLRAMAARSLPEALGLLFALGASLAAALIERPDTALAVLLFAALAGALLAGLGLEPRWRAGSLRAAPPILAALALAGLASVPGGGRLETVGGLLALRALPEAGLAAPAHAAMLAYWTSTFAAGLAGLVAGAAVVRALLAPQREPAR